jgi:DNA-directed RNA polymerase subunit RPC12/RpoP
MEGFRMMTEESVRADKLIKYECSTCEEEITLNLKAVIYTKVVNCPYCNPAGLEAVG